MKDWVKNQPNGGRGIYSKIAESLRTSNAAISQIINDDRDLSLEQAAELAEFIKLNNDESDFLILLVEYGRAGSEKLKKRKLSRINTEQTKQKDLINSVPKDVTLTDDIKAIYYSSWVYTGIRNFIATAEDKSVDQLAQRFNINPEKLTQIIQFLVQHQLLLNQNGRLAVGPRKTHLESTSPWIIKHHQNWRFKSIERMQNQDQRDFFYSAPMSLSKELAEKIRLQLPDLIKQIVTEVGDSKSEVIRCLNLDWFEY